LSINEEEYDAKVRMLQSLFKKDETYFYLPILDGNTWKITKFEKGEETTIDLRQFKESLH
jgi:hypothetical protein